VHKGDEQKAERLQKEALDMLDEIAAEPRINWALTLNRILNLFWKRMYEGVVVGEKGFETIRKAIRKAPVVFCPSHKSHVDYLIISQLCLQYRVPVPHIAAGVNLSFWPMGPRFYRTNLTGATLFSSIIAATVTRSVLGPS